jgi:glycosyltransferase involved in cell wall biosynthesis
MMTLRIGIDYTSAIHQSAGIGRYTRELVKALAACSTREFETQYALFAANGHKLEPYRPRSNFSWCSTRLSERWLARLWYRLYLPVWIEYWTGPLDLFHATDFFLPPVKPTTRTLLTVHDLSFVREPDTVMPGMTAHLNTWVPRSVERADHIVAVSKATRRDLIELYQTPPEKISVLYHGATGEFRPVETAFDLEVVRRKFRLGSEPFILSLGTIQPRKNYQRLIQAFAKIQPSVSLVIGGSLGWGFESVFAEVHRHGLEDRVHFIGFVADADLPALYSAASLFVYPSLYEGFGLPALEAMACGTPVVASNRSSLPEVVGEAGLLVDPLDPEALAEAMAKVLSDPCLHQRLSTAGRLQAAKFSWNGLASQLLKLYQNLIEE